MSCFICMCLRSIHSLHSLRFGGRRSYVTYRPTFTSLRSVHFTHLSTPQHKWLSHSMPQNPRSHSISFNGCLSTHVENLANFARFATFHPQKQPVKLHSIPPTPCAIPFPHHLCSFPTLSSPSPDGEGSGVRCIFSFPATS